MTPQEPQRMHGGGGWRWPHEPATLAPNDDSSTGALHAALHGFSGQLVENETLRQAVIDDPDGDAPRIAYAEWLFGQDREYARLIGAFICAQLRVARAYRAQRGADVAAFRRWAGSNAYISPGEFRGGAVLRPWLTGSVASLVSAGVIAWPQVFRGFVERVCVDGRDFLAVADELFRLAPIRHLVLSGIPAVVDELAACPHLRRVRSLSLARYSADDELTDDALVALIRSPYLGNLAHLRLVHQPLISEHAYKAVATAATVPTLSSLEVYVPRFGWEHMATTYYAAGRFQRMMTVDSAIPAVRSHDWIGAVQREIGFIPCFHTEHYYGRGMVDIEAVIENPIALDERVMRKRGLPMYAPLWGDDP